MLKRGATGEKCRSTSPLPQAGQDGAEAWEELSSSKSLPQALQVKS
jgi:hypothetical protein